MTLKKIATAALAASFLVTGAGLAEAAGKKKIRGSDFTKQQRKEFMDMAQKGCMKRYGTRVWQIDWYRLKIWCEWT